ncbi:hypothetical protein AcW1_008507 [Taiwanofungus camphoratus]|nr:hypothetical protein AcW1_008507 [Antrodia cinnamomea]
MAGDHKCPVCQSTFTRPQHVARHMRSHTGDRPYKCQHCGDQFARSDLLSRHVNKCHASEKPPTTTAPNRRKGAAAASRATTSKQACDQCVQSSLPCDGANPCSKCVQRKCRCTYVKFHRQTAPQGPGHPVPNQSQQPPRHALLPDDFMLAPPAPTSFGFPNVYSGPGANPSADFGLPQASSSVYAQSYGARASPSTSLDGSPELMARYRAQAELLSRAGVLPNGSLAMNSNIPPPGDGVVPGLYGDPQPQTQFNRYTLPVPTSSGWAHPHQQQHQQSFPVDGHRQDRAHGEPYAQPRQSFPGGGREDAVAAGESALQTHPPAHGGGGGHAFPPLSAPDGNGYHPHPHAPGLAFRHRAEELNDDFGSDGARSVPGSANSSTVHLPPTDQHPHARHQQAYAMQGFPTVDDAHDNASKHEYGRGAGDVQGEGGFSSAFGLMSLDDPNVLAGLSADSAPFFSGLGAEHGGGSGNSSNGASMLTPTQDLIAALKTGRGDADAKELRDFWKMYMRTPLSGPGGASALALATPTGTGTGTGMAQMLGSGRPSPTRRHSRVASLPSMKTPPLHADPVSAFPPLSRFNLTLDHARRGEHENPHPHPGPQQQQQQQQRADQARGQGGAGTGTFSSMRTTLHDTEDLKSYEQAVLARKAPMTLNLVPKRKATLPSGSTNPHAAGSQQQQTHAHDAGGSKNGSPVATHLPPPPAMGNRITDLLNRPSSTASTSSLAYVFGSENAGKAHAGHQQHPSRGSSSCGQQSMRPGSAASSTAVGSDCGTDSDASSYRPSFKRLASQTLGPEHSKRALLGPAGWDEDAVDEGDGDGDDDEEDGDGELAAKPRSVSTGADEDANLAGKIANRPIVGLTDRHRRMSCPTTVAGGVPGSSAAGAGVPL